MASSRDQRCPPTLFLRNKGREAYVEKGFARLSHATDDFAQSKWLFLSPMKIARRKRVLEISEILFLVQRSRVAPVRSVILSNT